MHIVRDNETNFWDQDVIDIIPTYLNNWKLALSGGHSYLIWSPEYHKATKLRMARIYKHLLTIVDETTVVMRARKSWGSVLGERLQANDVNEAPPTDSDTREIMEWTRINHPLVSCPDWRQHLYTETVREYIDGLRQD